MKENQEEKNRRYSEIQEEFPNALPEEIELMYGSEKQRDKHKRRAKILDKGAKVGFILMLGSGIWSTFGEYLNPVENLSKPQVVRKIESLEKESQLIKRTLENISKEPEEKENYTFSSLEKLDQEIQSKLGKKLQIIKNKTDELNSLPSVRTYENERDAYEAKLQSKDNLWSNLFSLGIAGFLASGLGSAYQIEREKRKTKYLEKIKAGLGNREDFLSEE